MEFSSPLIAYLSVFAGGLIASISPCTLILFPLIISFVGGYSDGDAKRSAFYSLVFSLGLAVTFTLFGAIAALTGTLFGHLGGYWQYLLAAVAIFMGLQMLAVTKLQFPTIGVARIKQRGLFGAFLLGLLFGLTVSPCATPVLAFVLTYVASQQNILYGVSLLFVYALAYFLVIFAVGLSTGLATAILKSEKFQRTTAFIHKASGVLLILIGLWLLF